MEKIDLIALIITLGIGYFLYSILGKKTGHISSFSSVTPDAAGPEIYGGKKEAEILDTAPPLITGLKQLLAVNPKFNHLEFLSRIQHTFKDIINAFVNGDRPFLQNHLKNSLYTAYEAALTERENAGQQVELVHFRCVKSEITDIQVHDHQAQITVKFKSEQIQLLKDKDNILLDGNPDIIDDIEEMWVFEKNLKKSQSEWLLVKTYASR